jgi:EAL domain-containing protein (putative c-di-GMP-specific phosphodiesterase class I)
MELVAEGVETEEQLRYLAERECGVIQGYYFSRPLKPDEFVTFCQEWRNR